MVTFMYAQQQIPGNAAQLQLGKKIKIKGIIKMQNSKFKIQKLAVFLTLFIVNCSLLIGTASAQFTTGNDTLVILSGDSTSHYYTSYDVTADTSGGQPYVGKTAGYDLNGKIVVGIDFDTSAAFTAAKFIIQTSATYNEDADTTGGTPYDWKTVNYEGTVYTFTPEVGAINLLDPKVIYALKRYVRFGCLDSGDAWDTEAARRKLVPLIRSAF